MSYSPSIFKAYDIRGIFPDEIDAKVAYKIGSAYAKVIKPQKKVAVGRDVRLHSKEIQAALMRGLADAGAEVLDIGFSSTEMLYFAVGKYGCSGGLQATASHNPKEYHGVKMVRENVIPVFGKNGMLEIKSYVEKKQSVFARSKKHKIVSKNVLEDYLEFLSGWIDSKKIRPLKIVYNPNFGYEGVLLESFVKKEKLPLELVPLNNTPDGSFPKGRPDPFIPENRIELIKLVKKVGADLGVAWDADADRVFFCADGGLFLEPYYTNTILIKVMLKKYPRSKIVYDPRYTWALIDTIKENGGTPVMERVGHSFIKYRMRKENAVFCGESSGHTYYRDFWYADTGMIPFLQLIEFVSSSSEKLSEVIKPLLRKYFISGEINSVVKNKDLVFQRLESEYSGAKIDKTDGITIECGRWRANIRASNTEPKVRLNVEAKDRKLMESKKDELLEIIRSNDEQ